MPFHGNTNLLCGFVLVHLFIRVFLFFLFFKKCKLLMCVLPTLAIDVYHFPSLLRSLANTSTLIACHPCTVWFWGLHISLAIVKRMTQVALAAHRTPFYEVG